MKSLIIKDHEVRGLLDGGAMKLPRWTLRLSRRWVRWPTGRWVEYRDAEKLQRELDAWWAIAQTVLEDGRNTLCDESWKLLENIVKEGAR